MDDHQISQDKKIIEVVKDYCIKPPTPCRGVT